MDDSALKTTSSLYCKTSLSGAIFSIKGIGSWFRELILIVIISDTNTPLGDKYSTLNEAEDSAFTSGAVRLISSPS